MSVQGESDAVQTSVTVSSKAVAVLCLGILGLTLSPLIGGVIPAAAALVLAEQTREELRLAAGFLSGKRNLRAGVLLSWIAVWMSMCAAVVLSVMFLLTR